MHWLVALAAMTKAARFDGVRVLEHLEIDAAFRDGDAPTATAR